MRKSRPIIEIDEEKCTGCGDCVMACAEGALEIIDGKAKLVGEIYCDGLGACIGDCPEGALVVIEREADDFDEEAVEELLNKNKEEKSEGPKMACGCPGSMVRVMEPVAFSTDNQVGPALSALRQWPTKLQLLSPQTPFLKGADLALLADCVAAAYPDLHQNVLKDYAIMMGCPKLDDNDAHIERLTEILEGANPKSLTVFHMEVPCCSGFVYAAQEAIKNSGVKIPLKAIQIGIKGEILQERDLSE
jgi:NAD-dependent dihydropyrimidine dehydrogenase PreA subunit